MNNAVGYARPARFANPVALGTDGIGADMLEEFRLAFARLREDDVTASPDIAVVSGSRTAGRSCPRPATTGSPGPTTTPTAVAPRLHHRTSAPLDVVVDGEVVLADGRATRVDADEIRARAAEQAARLVRRIDSCRAGRA